MKLENLVVYLPYGLRLIHEGEPIQILELSIDEYPSNDTITINSALGVNKMVGYVVIKPILRPMKDLTVEECKEIYSLTQYDILDGFIRKKPVNKFPYDVVVYLISKHFDVFNLIPSGQAIDINTITQ